LSLFREIALYLHYTKLNKVVKLISTIDRLVKLAEDKNLDALILSGVDNIEYFLDVTVAADSPMLLIYVKRENTVSLYVPLLEYYRYRTLLPEYVSVYALSKTQKAPDIPTLAVDWKDVVNSVISKCERVGADLSHTSSLQALLLEALTGKAVNVSNDIWNVRSVKTEKEIATIREAVHITTAGILSVQASIVDGVTESYLAGVFEHTTRSRGVEKMAFDPIVAFKPNNAYPHVLPSNRTIGKKDLVLVDVGVKYRGRCSDITRMIIRGRLSKEEKRSLQAVLEALETAIDTITPGVRAKDVYEAACRVLEKWGLRERFIHGLGHGVGIVVHEPPYLRADSTSVLEPSMVITIEPGVYFNGYYGVRVEDVVVVSKRKARVLSENLSRVLEAIT
jgi:Xaa-Pro dipeptidase